MSETMTLDPLALADDKTAAAEERLARLFDRCQPRLYRLALRLSAEAEEARDLVQEAFLRAARRPGALPRDDGGAEAWLVRVVVNLCRDRHRRRRVREAGREQLPDRLAAPPSPPSPESAAVARATVAAALAELPPRRRAAVALAELEGLDTGEVARLLGISRITVRWHLAAGRAELARRLLGRGREEGPEEESP